MTSFKAKFRMFNCSLVFFSFDSFQVYTGDEWYVHLQLKMPTQNESFIASLIACRGDLNAEVPLEPLDVSSNENRCRPPITNFVCSNANPIEQISVIFMLLVLLGNVVISNVVNGSIAALCFISE